MSAIVKLQMRYEGQESDDKRWAMGTGWLVAPDILVTAGHCVHMFQNGWGHVAQVNAHIGYNGKASIGTQNVQSRQGVRAVTTEGWLASNENRQNDVGFIKLDRPFDNVTPFEIGTTPGRGEDKLGVVGYPGDMTDPRTRERGYHMFEEFQPTRFNLESAKPAHMITYKVSTYNGEWQYLEGRRSTKLKIGQNGSPVLIERNGQVTNVAIGVHVYGGAGDNAASAINGQHGNPFDVYLSALGLKTQTQVPQNVVRSNINSNPSRGVNSVFSSNSTSFGEESFFDTLRSVARIGTSTVKASSGIGTPFLGPVGVVASALANVALASAGSRAISGDESALDDPNSEGLVERAVLAGAALQTVLTMPADKMQRLGIISAMRQNYDTSPKASDDVAPKILAPVLESTLRMTQQQLEPSDFGAEPSRQEAVRAAEEAFREHVGNPSTARPMGLGSEEGSMDVVGSVGDFTRKGLAFGKPVAMSMIKQGLNKLASLVTESSIEDDDSEHLNQLAKRAVMGEAALRALTSLPPQELQEEGFFDSICNTIKSIAGRVTEHAPTIINGVTKVVGTLTQESANAGPVPGRYRTGGLAPSQPPGLHRKKSPSLFDTLSLGDPTGDT